MKTLRQIVGENLTELRKNKKLTQFELAEQLNYSDKSISKWENGDNLPDLETLNELCNFYGVTLDYLTHPVEENKDKYVLNKDIERKDLVNHIFITLFVNLVVWFIATIVFVYALIKEIQGPFWLAFVYAVPLSCVITAVFTRVYFRKVRLMFFICWSVFIWSLTACAFLTALPDIIWPIFLVGVPAQGALVAWFLMKKK